MAFGERGREGSRDTQYICFNGVWAPGFQTRFFLAATKPRSIFVSVPVRTTTYSSLSAVVVGDGGHIVCCTLPAYITQIQLHGSLSSSLLGLSTRRRPVSWLYIWLLLIWDRFGSTLAWKIQSSFFYHVSTEEVNLVYALFFAVRICPARFSVRFFIGRFFT